LCIKSWHCRHHPLENPKVPHLAGHLHPGFSIRGKSRTGVRSACFQVSENRIILPAFGSFTGLMEVKPTQGDRIFMTNEHEIVPLPPF
ncbi:MAG: metallophosphoesterase, partial [Verrucomicrobiota bacterium]|nr:metallophosphoesterase [Verrucomicrobiota bacterium]